jgi:transposase
MRRSFDRLARMVAEQIQENPLSGDIFVFINRSSSRLKALYWDSDGYVLWYKRLEQGQFPIPGGEKIELNRAEWITMLEGLEIKVMNRQRRYSLARKKDKK